MPHDPTYDEDDLSRREMNPDDFDEENEDVKPKKLLESEHTQDPDDIDAGWDQEPEAEGG